jgi:nitronate monooxygenase
MQKSSTLSKLLNIKYPVVQGAMLGVSTPAMAAAVSNSGGLGSLAVGGLSPEKTAELIRETKQLTNRPFAVNLFANPIPENIDAARFNQMQNFLKDLLEKNNIPFERKEAISLRPNSYIDQIDVLIREKVNIVSFTFGLLNEESISKLKHAGILLIGTATCVQEAVLLYKNGIDIITAQGIEAGGHRGSFLDQDVPQIGSMSLIPLIADAVDIPILAAGGIADGRAFRAAMALGASGVQIGSIFIPSTESIASNVYKQAVMQAADVDTTLTKAFTGRWARGIKNKFMAEFEKSGLETPDYTAQVSLTGSMRSYATQHDQKDFISMWAGQSSSKAVRGTTTEIFMKLVNDAGIDK